MRSSDAEKNSGCGASPYPVLLTRRLRVREPRDEDAAGLLTISRDPLVMRYYGMDPFADLDETLREIAWMRDLRERGAGLRWIVALKSDDSYIGDIGFHDADNHHHRAELGYKLARRAWRQGLMSEAMAVVLGYGFGAMGLNRAHALVDPRNHASQGLVSHFGFRREGLLRDYERESSGFVDLEMWALLRNEWISRQATHD